MEALLSGAACAVMMAGVLAVITLGDRAQTRTQRNSERTRLRAELADARPAPQEVQPR